MNAEGWARSIDAITDKMVQHIEQWSPSDLLRRGLGARDAAPSVVVDGNAVTHDRDAKLREAYRVMTWDMPAPPTSDMIVLHARNNGMIDNHDGADPDFQARLRAAHARFPGMEDR